jgi:hypothetical protein
MVLRKPSDNILKYGYPDPLPAPQVFHAGGLTMIYQDGFIRYLKLGNVEVLRMINHLVRDKNWNTIPQNIENEVIENRGDSFRIKYNCRARQGEVDFLWECQIMGTTDNRLVFSINGRALSSFKRNRIGFTVLHPNRECRGQPVTIWHSDGSEEISHFPELISPHQPFLDIRTMEWGIGTNRARLEFSGEVFETEDQRNWTDDSYKTYCTPLALPFPQQLEVGDEVQQKIELSIAGEAKPIATGEQKFTFEILPHKYQLPKIGVGRSTEVDHLSEHQLKWIKAVGFDHYQVDLKLFEASWKPVLDKAVEEADKLDIPLEITLFFKDTKQELKMFLDHAVPHATHIGIINVFDFQKPYTSEKTLDQTLAGIKAVLPQASVGAGTNAFFTELNRNRINHEALDHLVYSINPQVHAFDNDSLVESLYAQPATVETALSFSAGKPVHISPVTLKMRWNPNATESDDSGVAQTDPRQKSLFGACWLLGSIQNLMTTNLKVATYFETAGSKGILDHHQLFPMYFVFRFLLQRKREVFYTLDSSDLLSFGGVMVGQQELMLANYTDNDLTISLPSFWYSSKAQMIDQDQVWDLMTAQMETDQLPVRLSGKSVTLTAYSLALLHR